MSALVVVLLAAAVLAVGSKEDRAGNLITVLGIWAGVLVILAGYLLRLRQAARVDDTDIADVADKLAAKIRKQWWDELRHRAPDWPPMEVAWQPADPSLVQPWSSLQRLAASGAGWTPPVHPAADPRELAGSGTELIEVFDRVPTGRLVVLGEPGSGKTLLLIRLVLDLIDRRVGGGPVPLFMSLASFDPHDSPDRANLYVWLEKQIIQTYPRLGRKTTTGVSQARALLDDGLVLPVLDSLDEIRTGGRDRAIAAINRALLPGRRLVLSCRAKEFPDAIRLGPHHEPIHLEGAAGIRLAPLDPGAVAAYLTETAGASGPARWAPVRAALATTPAPPVAEALSTPLMASLARTIYNPRPGGSTLGLPAPAELCDTTERPTRTAVEEHLFDGLIPAVYRDRGDRTVTDAERYLVFLARHLDRRGATGLAWWDLAHATPPALPRVASGLAFVLAFWLAGTLQGGLVPGPTLVVAVVAVLAVVAGPRSRSPSRLVLRWSRRLFSELVHKLLVALGFGFGFGFLSGFVDWLPGMEVPEVFLIGQFFVRITNWPGRLLSRIRIRGRRMRWLAVGPGAAAFIDRSTSGFVFGLSAGLPAGLAAGLGSDTPADTTREAVDPQAVLRQDRKNALTAGLVAALGVGLGLWIMARVGLAAGLWLTVGVGLAAGLAVGVDSAWGRLGLVRLWLAPGRHQPLRLMAFLADAHKRGVLRQASAVWEFRHANLQRRLANRPDHTT